MNAGHIYSCCKDKKKRKTIVLKRWTRIQLYAVTNFHGSLTMTVNDKNGRFSSFRSELRKFLAGSDVELPEQDSVEQFRDCM